MLNNNRRNFVKLLPYVLGGSFAYPIGKFIFFSDTKDRKISIPLKNIKDGITYIKQSKLYIHKNNQNIEIYDAHCTHMGCIINFDNSTQNFNCPCHKSRFDIDGTKLRGPAKRDLDKIAFKIQNKILYIG